MVFLFPRWDMLVPWRVFQILSDMTGWLENLDLVSLLKRVFSTVLDAEVDDFQTRTHTQFPCCFLKHKAGESCDCRCSCVTTTTTTTLPKLNSQGEVSFFQKLIHLWKHQFFRGRAVEILQWTWTCSWHLSFRPNHMMQTSQEVEAH